MNKKSVDQIAQELVREEQVRREAKKSERDKFLKAGIRPRYIGILFGAIGGIFIGQAFVEYKVLIIFLALLVGFAVGELLDRHKK